MQQRKPHGRVPAARAQRHTSEPATQDGQLVRFTAKNGESYQIDVVKMYQRNVRNGRRRLIRRKGGKWFYDNAPSRELKQSSSKSPDASVKHQWSAYSNQLQSVLESTFQGSLGTVEVDRFDKIVHQTLQCSNGHRMIIDPYWSHRCNLCEAQGTKYRCSENCDYDICEQCSHGFQDCSSREDSTGSAAAMADQAPAGSLSSQDARAVCQAILTTSARTSLTLHTLQALSKEQHLKFSVKDVRRAALDMGSAAALQVVLCSAPQVQLLGLDIFDRRYPGLVLNPDVKGCIRLLLRRGAILGSSAPASKLLRKIEADELHAWARRYLNSMARASMELPEALQHHVFKSLG